jgi:hypothetical protein
MTTIKPDDIFCDDIDGIIVTGFRQGDDYFIIQREDLETSNFHVELKDQGQGCYDGLNEIIIQDDKIIFRLNLLGQAALQTDTVVISDRINEKTEYKKIIEELKLINKRLKR